MSNLPEMPSEKVMSVHSVHTCCACLGAGDTEWSTCLMTKGEKSKAVLRSAASQPAFNQNPGPVRCRRAPGI